MAEWFKAPVLKTGLGQPNEGSNPSFSAEKTGDHVTGFSLYKNLFRKDPAPVHKASKPPCCTQNKQIQEKRIAYFQRINKI